MALEEEAELDALLQALAQPGADAEYPLPEEKPIKYTNADFVVLLRGYMGHVKQNQEGRRYRFATGGPLRGAYTTFLVTVVSVKVRSKANIAVRKRNGLFFRASMSGQNVAHLKRG